MIIESDIKVNNAMVEDAMAEEEESKFVQVVQQKMRPMMEKRFSQFRYNIPMQFV